MKREFDRDQGLRRVSRITRWTATGALVSAGVLSIAAAESLPGRSSASEPGRSVAAPASSSTTPSSGATQSPTTTTPLATTPVTTPATLALPQQAPQSTYNAPVVASGGS
jgi:hypothetical protein